MSKPFVVELPLILWHDPWPMVFLPWPSGAIFDVLCGCVANYHRQIEAFYLPVYGRYDLALLSRVKEVHPGCCGAPLTLQEADALDALFAEFNVPLKIVRSRLEESTEAWVHVEIIQPNEDKVLMNFGGRAGVLVWPNCE